MDRRIRRATSAGYRLPERPSVPLASQSSVSVKRPPPRSSSEPQPDPGRNPDTRNPVQQDRVWRELVRAEREGLKEWEKNWNFLKDFDQLGHPRTEAPLPSYVSLYSDTLPNTSNQTFGSRICTELDYIYEYKVHVFA
ncbi:C2orf50-like protein, partial [Clarias magur]